MGDVWQVFNDTVRMMNDSANLQYSQSIQDINASRPATMDPSDTVAYNMTMDGMNTIHDIQMSVINPLSHLKSAYDGVMQGSSPSVGSLPDPTATHSGNAIGSLMASPGSVLPANNFLLALLCIVIGIAIGGMIFNKK